MHRSRDNSPSRLPHRPGSVCLVLLLALLPCRPLFAQTAYPMLMSVHPVAAQRGTNSEHTVRSRYSMYGASQVLVSGEGVTGEVLPHAVKAGQKVPSLTNLKIRLTVSPTAATGVRDLRIVTPRGVSTVGRIVIANDEVVVEASENNSPDAAQSVPVPATLCGAIERAEDVDYFRFAAKKGQTLCFHTRAMRLQDRIHDLQQHIDLLLTVRSANGSTLATADNTFAADPVLCHTFAADGEYLLEVRDVRYQGNPFWEYSIEMLDQPLPVTVFPLAVPQRPADVRLVGFNLPPVKTVRLTPPATRGFADVAVPLVDDRDVRVAAVVSDLPLVSETAGPNDLPSDAQEVPVPSGINGCIDRDADVDCYAFAATKGQTFAFEVVARRRQSQLDSVLRILDAQGRRLVEQDDMLLYKHTYQDSRIESWTAPADGTYYLEIRDLHLRGGPGFVYFIQATRPQPGFELYLDTDKTQLTPGTSGVIFASVVRRNGFAGEVRLKIDGLPPGVTAAPGRILAGGRDGCVVLTANETARPAASPVIVTGVAVEGDRTLEVTATPWQEIYQPGGGRGHWPVDEHVVAIAQPADLRGVKISPREITLRPGESQRVDIEVIRAPGFTKNVQLDALFRHLSTTYADTLPQGVTIDSANSRTLLTGDNSKGHITFRAAANAPTVEAQQVAIMANISLNFVMKWTYSSQPLTIRVVPAESARKPGDN